MKFKKLIITYDSYLWVIILSRKNFDDSFYLSINLIYFIHFKSYNDLLEGNKIALALKEKGNDAFKRKEYEVAEKFYSEGIEISSEKSSLDMRPLWTNRAICRNILKKHEDALGDCFLALWIDPKCTKAGFQSEC